MFPSVLNTFNRPSASDRLNNPSHSALHNTVSSALGQVEATIGIRGDSSVVGTLNSAVFSPGSTGGGHVQGAAFGGTGQTTYTKGDILVGQSASVLSKVAVGQTGFGLVANSAAATGLSYSRVQTNVLSSVLTRTINNTSAETSIFSVSIPGSVLSTSNVIRAKTWITARGTTATPDLLITANYGGTVAQINMVGFHTFQGSLGEINFTLFGAGTASSQRGILRGDFFPNAGAPSIIGIFQTVGTASVASSATATLGMTAKWSASSSSNTITFDSVIVDTTTGI